MVCKELGCRKQSSRKDGRCELHYRKNLPGKRCTIDGCDARAIARGWCGKHWQRWKRWGDPTYAEKEQLGYGSNRINSNGYVVEYVPGHIEANDDGKCMQHRRIMADHLGRRLKKHENVHHKNGVRHDNRLENLELWIVRQPYGQRVEDLLEWADWIISEYRSDQRP